MINENGQPLPSVRQLLRAILLASGVAAVILVGAVLPAEYGIDPTGAGRRLGLLRPGSASAPTGSAPAPSAESVVPADLGTLTPGQPVMRE